MQVLIESIRSTTGPCARRIASTHIPMYLIMTNQIQYIKFNDSISSRTCSWKSCHRCFHRFNQHCIQCHKGYPSPQRFQFNISNHFEPNHESIEIDGKCHVGWQYTVALTLFSYLLFIRNTSLMDIAAHYLSQFLPICLLFRVWLTTYL